jgi:hypothetical protein
VFIQAGNGAGGNDKVQIINGGVNFFDAGFSQVTGVEQFEMAAGFSNRLQLNFNADNNAATNQTGSFEVISGGGGLITSSTFVDAGAGYNHPLLFTVTNGGDGGGDHVTTHLSFFAGSNPLTVTGKATDLAVSFLAAPLTIQGDAEGIFGTTSAANTLRVIADNTTLSAFGGASGINGMQTILGVNPGFSADLGIWLVNNAVAAGTPEVVDLTAVTGNTLVLGTLLTKSLDIDGGSGNTTKTNTLFGSSNNDSITTHGTGFQTVYGFLGADVLTLNPNGASGQPETVVYNSVAESNSSNPASTRDLIQNFHGGPGGPIDQLSINPATLVGGGMVLVGPNTGASSYADALTFLTGGGVIAEAVLIATGADSGQFWIDVNADGDLNASDYSFDMTFASPPFITIASLTTVPPANVTFTASGPALVEIPILDLTIPAWNIALPPAIVDLLHFVGVGGAMTTDTKFHNYDFSDLLSGVVATTQGFNGGPVFAGGVQSSILGSDFDDTFRVTRGDLTVVGNGLAINGGDGDDTLVLRNPGGLAVHLGPTSPGFNAITNIETLNPVDATLPYSISFSAGAGQAFKNINGSATNTAALTINTLNLVPGGTIDLSADMGNDVVNLDANLPGSTIKLNGLSTVNMNFIGFGNPLTTTIIGKFNLDSLVLNAGASDYYRLDLAIIEGVTTLDMTAAVGPPGANEVYVLAEQIGGLKGFTNILLTGNNASTIHIVERFVDQGTADFTNVTLSDEKFVLHIGDKNTVNMLTDQLPFSIVGLPTGANDIVINFTDDDGIIELEGTNFVDLGTVSWKGGSAGSHLDVDNTAISGGSPHGIVGLIGDGDSLLHLTDGGGPSTMDMSNIATWSGIKTVWADLDNGDTLRMAAHQLVSMNGVPGGGAALVANSIDNGANNLNLVIDATASYNLATPIGGGPTQLALTDANGGDWDSVDFDGDNVGGITITITDLMLDNSNIDTVLGDTTGPETDHLIVHDSNTSVLVDLSNITTFDGFNNVSVIAAFSGVGPRTFHVNDTISNEVVKNNGGTALLDLNNDNDNVAWLDTSALSAQTSKAATGFDTHWDIFGFNAGAADATILRITQTFGPDTDLVGSNFINIAGAMYDADDMNVISGNLAPVTDLFDLTNGGTVETAIAVNAGLVSSGQGINGPGANATAYFLIYGAGPASGTAGVYMMVLDTAQIPNGDAFAGDFNNFSMNLIGVLHDTAIDSLQPQNFF